MKKSMKEWLKIRWENFAERFSKIREINRKYAKPRLQMTPGVRFALFMLRIYLLFLVGLLFYKFITIVK